MTSSSSKRRKRDVQQEELEDLRRKLAETEETLRAIQNGEVDAVVVTGSAGEQVFTLKGADHSYRVLVEQMKDAALIVSMDGTILYANRHFAEMVQVPLEKIIGTPIQTHVLAEDTMRVQSYLDRKTEGSCKGEIHIRTGEGQSIPSCFSLTFLDDASGICIVATDLTEQKRIEEELRQEYQATARELERANEQLRAENLQRTLAEQELAESMQMLRDRNQELSDRNEEIRAQRELLIDFSTQVEYQKRQLAEVLSSSPDIMMVVDRALRITYINDLGAEVVGRTPEELIGKGWGDLDLSTNDTMVQVLRDVKSVLESGQRITVDHSFRRRDKEEFRQTIFTPMFDLRSGQVKSVHITSRDITTLKRTTEALLSANEQLQQYAIETGDRKRELETIARNLQQSNEDLERFAYIASHDLKEPIRNIVSYAQLLSRRYQGRLDSTADDYIQFVVEGGKRMDALTTDLLEYSRVTSRGKSLTATESEKALEKAIENLQLRIRESDARISYENLPNVLADEFQLMQVFQNLLDNALKFRGEPDPVIRIRAEREGTLIRFSVSDNGIGIPREYQDRIFTIFQRLHTRDKYPGTGVGLAIVKRILDRHGGSIWVESEEGMGTTFCFTLLAAD